MELQPSRRNAPWCALVRACPGLASVSFLQPLFGNKPVKITLAVGAGGDSDYFMKLPGESALMREAKLGRDLRDGPVGVNQFIYGRVNARLNNELLHGDAE